MALAEVLGAACKSCPGVGCASGDAECFARVVLTHLLKTEELVHSGEEPLPALALCHVEEAVMNEVAPEEEAVDAADIDSEEVPEVDAAKKSEEVVEEIVEDIVEEIVETDPVKVRHVYTSIEIYENAHDALHLVAALLLRQLF